MTRLANVEKAGYFPIPVQVTRLILSHIAAPHGGRILDPCAGEGEALAQLADALQLEPYGVELHRERAAAANETVGQMLAGRESPEPVKRRVLHDSYQNLKATNGAFNLLYENPPYLQANDKQDGRAEYQWLRDTRPFLQPGGLLVWVVPQHLLAHRKAARYLAAWFTQLRIYRFPDPAYERFKQVIVFGQRHERAQIPDRERIARLRQLAQQGPQLRSIPLADSPRYILPPLTVPAGQLTFRGLFVDPETALAEAQTAGVVASSAYRQHLVPGQVQARLQPLTPMKIGHLTGIIAAGFLNNKTIEQDDQRLLIKGLSYKEKRTSQHVEQQGEKTVTQTLHTDTVVTRITTLDEQGKLDHRQGEQLQPFLSQWIDQLTAQIAADYPPTYRFDLNGYGQVLSRLNLSRTIPLVGLPGLLPAQKHAAAAAATRLEDHPDALIVGEMGTGKTLMGPATAAALRSRGIPMNHILVLCPPHLVAKWKREIQLVWPAARVIILKRLGDVDRFFATPGPVFGILKETTARAGSGWSHAFNHCGPVTAARRSPKQPVCLQRHGRLVGEGQDDDTIARLRYQSWRGIRCPTCGLKIVWDDAPADAADFKTQRATCPACHMPLYQDERQRGRARYPLATYIKKRYKKQLDLLIADECHQFKGADSDRGYAFHRLATAAKRVLGLTGTIYGGKASSLFYLLYRMSPDVRHAFTSFQASGKRRLRLGDWVAQYGILQEIQTVTFDESGAQSGNRKSKVRVKELPGGSPAMLPWLLNNAIFVNLADMGFALPSYEEIPIAVEMTPEMAGRYRRFQTALKEALAQRLVREDKSLLGAYLQALLTWPDSPWRGKVVADNQGQTVATVDALPAGRRYPKETAIIDLIQAEKACGRRVLLLCQQTSTLDITPQWVEMLQQAGLKTAVLKVEPGKREGWVEKQVARSVDVIITHPKRVETGLDLLDFPTIVWMGTEYSVYTILQASRRSWRIGQTRPVRVYFFVYSGTLQEEALKLIAAKVGATLRINGDTVPDDSLAELDDLAQTDMVTALASIVAGENQTVTIPSLQDAFSQANDELSQANRFIGDYQQPDETDPMSRLTEVGKIQVTRHGRWRDAVVQRLQDSWQNDYIRWPDECIKPLAHLQNQWQPVPPDTPLTSNQADLYEQPDTTAPEPKERQQDRPTRQVSIEELVAALDLEKVEGEDQKEEAAAKPSQRRLAFGVSKPPPKRRRRPVDVPAVQLSLFD